MNALQCFSTTLLCLTLAGTTTTGTAEPRSSGDWYDAGHAALERALAQQPITGRARNVILFVGDGNGVASVTATRIFDGQARGESGEENVLSFETFPHIALAKTYNTNQQTPDSAGTMSAIMTGAKTRAGVISVGPEVDRGDCRGAEEFRLPTLLEQAREKGLGTGVVTTTRVTHATPAATYAHAPERNWESDTDIPEAMRPCARDIARQLVEGPGLDVVLGGGRKHFLPAGEKDPEYPGERGVRGDGRNLVAEWREAHPEGRYLWNRAQFQALAPDFDGPLLGLFEPSHMRYEADREARGGDEPALSDMTRRAIRRLRQEEKGYFLMVEGGRIDHAHHAGNAYRALADGREFARAVQAAMDATDPSKTLIVVTADHGHVLTLGGYPTRGNPILGTVVSNDERGHPEAEPYRAADGRPYTTLGYRNGLGYGRHEDPADRYGQSPNPGRHLEPGADTRGKDFHQEALVPLRSETHGGEDVAIYARGPWAHLFQGVREQNYIYHVMRHALELDQR